MEIELVPLERLIPDPANPRKQSDPEADTELAASIAALDVKVPLICYRVPEGIMIWDGHRRYEAATIAGKKTVPAMIFPKKPGEAEALLARLVINGQRSDLNPVDRYEGYAKLVELKEWSPTQLATALSVSTAKVSSVLALGRLTAEERDLVRQGISESAAYALARMPAEQRAPLMAKAAAGKLTRDELNVKARRKSKEPQTGSRRIACLLPGGQVTVKAAQALSLSGLIDLLEELLRNCRRARSEGLDVSTAVRVWRDRAQAPSN